MYSATRISGYDITREPTTKNVAEMSLSSRYSKSFLQILSVNHNRIATHNSTDGAIAKVSVSAVLHIG